jgi:ubiquinone/menaquinone biosynthesis C-methylase UbiE
MSQTSTRAQANLEPIFSARPRRTLRLGGESCDAEAFTAETQRALRRRRELFEGVVGGLKRRWERERRRRKVGRAYDMAWEIARVIPRGSEVLDVGCGNGFIAHHLSAMLGADVLGIDLGSGADAPIDYRQYHGARFPAPDKSFSAVTLCYVLHHAQDIKLMLSELRRVLRDGGLAVIYEDIPRSWWDRGLCWMHNRQWKNRTGPCTFRLESEWRCLFETFGFEIVKQRPLSRWRNLTHPVSRGFYVVKLRPTLQEEGLESRPHTRAYTLRDVHAAPD